MIVSRFNICSFNRKNFTSLDVHDLDTVINGKWTLRYLHFSDAIPSGVSPYVMGDLVAWELFWNQNYLGDFTLE